jgi:hypothetical protein
MHVLQILQYTHLQTLCVSLNVTLGPLSPRTRREADRDGPERGELSKLAEFPLEFKLAPPMSSGLWNMKHSQKNFDINIKI